MAALPLILLIDDSDADNYFHRLVIKRSQIECEVRNVNGSLQGLDYLTQSMSQDDNSEYPTPRIIFLDINMPALNGFELLGKLRALPDPHERKKGIKIFMLTGSLNPDDRARANEEYSDLITAFRIKPLAESVVQEIAKEYFS